MNEPFSPLDSVRDCSLPYVACPEYRRNLSGADSRILNVR
jgi:hypothetical protein